ncbi:hypothetical protein GCM10027075_25580 [Streptomyces heilongjiangensis]
MLWACRAHVLVGMYLGLCPVRRECVPGVATGRTLPDAALAPSGYDNDAGDDHDVNGDNDVSSDYDVSVDHHTGGDRRRQRR